MNTVAEKRRILSMPSVQGEMKIRFSKHSAPIVIPFADIYTNKRHEYATVTVESELDYASISYLYVRPDEKMLVLWAAFDKKGRQFRDLFLQMEKRIPYKDVTILWCKYLGEASN
jgi:hypothetical protein